MLWEMVVCVACLMVLACGSSEPRSALILGSNPADAQPGPRTLTGSQARALRNLIASAGESCDAVERTYLRDADVVAGNEVWDVRCAEGTYTLVIRGDGTQASVRRCPGAALDVPCLQPYQGRSRRGTPGTLNPDLGKLLEPMTSKDGKTD
jgi:hypothetical protein